MADSVTIDISVPSDPVCLCVVRALVQKISELAGFDEAEVDRMVLAVDEACTNIIRHQYEGRRDERIEIHSTLGDGCERVEFVLRDHGPVRDASLFSGRDPGEVGPGGLGLRIIHEVMDEVDYSAAPGGGMQLRLVRTAHAS